MPEITEKPKKREKPIGTLKQRRVVRLLSENPRKPLGQAMRESGYSLGSSLRPGELTKSKNFQLLLEEFMPMNKLMQVGMEGLEANRVISARVTDKDAGVDTDDFIEVPDHAVRHKFYETGLKLHGKLRQDSPATQPIIVPIIIKRYDGKDRKVIDA